MNAKVQQVVDLLPIIYQLGTASSYITVLDKDGIICGYEIPEEETSRMQIGSRFEDPSGAFDEVLRTGKKKNNYLPKEVMGEAFEGILVPITDEGVVEGVLIYSYSVGEKEEILDMATEFNDAVNGINGSISAMLEGFQGINSTLKGINEKTAEVDESVKKAKDVVNTIQGNAKHSNILALNASIEAARSGEAGRGFAVVATEMGKLSNASGSSATEIDAALAHIGQQMDEIVKAINKTNEIADGYVADMLKTKEVLENTISIAEELKKKL